MQDLINLNVTPNPTSAVSTPPGSAPSSNTSNNRDLDVSSRSPFVCPLTLKEMTGALPFGVIKHCGCVFSEGGIKAVINSTSSSGSSSPKDNEPTNPNATTPKTLPCPNCSEPFDCSDGFGSGTGSAWWLPLNPKQEYQTQMLHDLANTRAAAKAAKKESGAGNKKRKSEAANGNGNIGVESGTNEGRTIKRSKPTSSSEHHLAPVKISNKVSRELAELESKRKASGMSEAVKSIYAGNNGGKDKGTSGNDFFMRTFNRVSPVSYVEQRRPLHTIR
jgi:hypothetical protein